MLGWGQIVRKPCSESEHRDDESQQAPPTAPQHHRYEGKGQKQTACKIVVQKQRLPKPGHEHCTSAPGPEYNSRNAGEQQQFVQRELGTERNPSVK
jgi:hypothetical protein